jgi:hypothetical protein
VDGNRANHPETANTKSDLRSDHQLSLALILAPAPGRWKFVRRPFSHKSSSDRALSPSFLYPAPTTDTAAMASSPDAGPKKEQIFHE